MAKLANKIALSVRSPDYRSLRAQLIRSSNSVPTNIVEGSGQESAKDFIRFLRYSINSANETEYHCYAAYDYGLIPEAQWVKVGKAIEEVRKMLSALIDYLRRKPDS
jgi:four helix bundle protein